MLTKENHAGRGQGQGHKQTAGTQIQYKAIIQRLEQNGQTEEAAYLKGHSPFGHLLVACRPRRQCVSDRDLFLLLMMPAQSILENPALPANDFQPVIEVRDVSKDF